MQRQVRILAALLAAQLFLVPASAKASPAEADVDGLAAYTSRYPFRGSTFDWHQSVNVLGLVKSSELTWNPVYTWLLRFNPRYYLTRDLYLRLKVGVDIEWTNADDTTRYREPRLEDLWLDLVYGSLYREKHTGIVLTPSLRLIAPTSLNARASSLYLGIGPGFSLRRSFDLPRGMAIELGYGFRYIKNLNHYSTVQNEAPTIASCGGAGGEGDCGQFLHTGARNASHELLNSVAVDWWATRKLRIGVSAIFRNQLLYGLSEATTQVPGVGTIPATDPEHDTNSRASIWTLIEAGYQVHPLLGVTLAVSTLNSQLAPDGKYYAPFFNRNTELTLSLEVPLDKIVAGIERRVRPLRTASQGAVQLTAKR